MGNQIQMSFGFIKLGFVIGRIYNVGPQVFGFCLLKCVIFEILMFKGCFKLLTVLHNVLLILLICAVN